MIALLRALCRLIGCVWTLALALLGLGIAAYCLDGVVSLGSLRPDRLIGLVTVHRRVGHFLAQLAASGPVAGLSLLCGVGAVVAGVVLLVCVSLGPNERLAILDPDHGGGRLAARPKILREMLQALVEHRRPLRVVREVKLSLTRRGRGGRVRVEIENSSTAPAAAARASVDRDLRPLSEPFALTPRVTIVPRDPARRVR
jgi:hypothetical protein